LLVEPPQLTVETVTPVESELPAIEQEGGSIEAIPRTDPSLVRLA